MTDDEKNVPETESEPIVNEENDFPTSETLPEEPVAKEAESAGKKVKVYGTGTAIAAFIFFAITLAVFVLYEYFAITFLYAPFANEVNNVGEAIAIVFGYTYGLVITIIFGLAQIPENIISIILFNRVRKCASSKAKKVVYTVFYALSIVMLIVMILTIGVFFAITGSAS